MQMSKHQRTSMSLAQRYGPVYIFLFKVRPPPPKKKVPFGSYLSRKAFITVLLHFASWFICECGNLTPFHPRRVFHSHLLQFALVCISHISLSNFVSFTFGAFVKNSACHQSPSACQPAPVVGQQQKNLSLFSSIMTSSQVCTSWLCVRRSSSWGQSLCVSGARSITSSII